MEHFPNRIRELRDVKGWSVRDLAERAGLDTSGVFRRETGDTDDLVKLRQIAKALGVKVSTLLDDTDVELRVDDVGQELIKELAAIPAEERPEVLQMARALVRVVRVTAAQKSGAAIGGDNRQIAAFSDMWNGFDHQERERALEIMRLTQQRKS